MFKKKCKIKKVDPNCFIHSKYNNFKIIFSYIYMYI